MITAGGWAAAAIAALSAWIAWRLLSSRMDSVARACHELRGPITAARLGLELGARPGALSSARLRALDLELGRAALAIDDLANVRALRRRPQPWEEVDLAELLTDSIEAWRPSAAARGVSLALQPPVAPVLVLGHRLRLAQATGNLLANAIEHGGGAVEVRPGRVRRRRAGTAGAGGGAGPPRPSPPRSAWARTGGCDGRGD
jgi:signal transduction histidine kinase